MASKGHFISKVDFPVYSIAWTGERELVVCGGGGAGRSGVKNSIVSGVVVCERLPREPPERRRDGVRCSFRRRLLTTATPPPTYTPPPNSPQQSICELDAKAQTCQRKIELELSRKEDAPSTIAVHTEVSWLCEYSDSSRHGSPSIQRVVVLTRAPQLGLVPSLSIDHHPLATTLDSPRFSEKSYWPGSTRKRPPSRRVPTTTSVSSPTLTRRSE